VRRRAKVSWRKIRPERIGVDRDQDQIAPAGKMPGRRLGGPARLWKNE